MNPAAPSPSAETVALSGIRFNDVSGVHGTIFRLRRYANHPRHKRTLLGQTMQEAYLVIENLLSISSIGTTVAEVDTPAAPVGGFVVDGWMIRLAKEIKANAEDHPNDYIAKFALAWADELAARAIAASPTAQPSAKDGVRVKVCNCRGDAGECPVCSQPDEPERDPSKPDTEQGLFKKYEDIVRTDGQSEPGQKHHDCEYFVIDVTHDRAAKAALSAYADFIESTHPLLAADMRVQYELTVIKDGDDDQFKTDRGVLEYLMQAFDSETWECATCGRSEQTKDMDSAYLLRRYLARNPQATTAAGLEDGKDTLRLAYVLSHVRFDEDGAFIPLGANKITAAMAVESLAYIDAAIPTWRTGEAAIGREAGE